MSQDQFKKLEASFAELENLLGSFKNSESSEIPKDLKFYKTVYGSTTVPAINQTLLSLHELQEKLNSTYLPNKYKSGDIKIFNGHQLEMIVKLYCFLQCL